MSGGVRERRPLASVLYDGVVTLAAVVTTVIAAAVFGRQADGGQWQELAWCVVVGLPLMQLLTRFPFQINTKHAGIEVQFDIGVLIFLLCVADPVTVAIAWCALRIEPYPKAVLARLLDAAGLGSRPLAAPSPR